MIYKKDKKRGIQIRNSTTDFIVFTKQAGEEGIEVFEKHICF